MIVTLEAVLDDMMKAKLRIVAKAYEVGPNEGRIRLDDHFRYRFDGDQTLFSVSVSVKNSGKILPNGGFI